MKRLFRRRPSPAMVIALVALFVSLAGVSYGAATIGSGQIINNSIRSKDVRNNSLTTKDIRDSTIRGRDVRNNTLTNSDIKNSDLLAGNASGLGGPLASGNTLRGIVGGAHDATVAGQITIHTVN